MHYEIERVLAERDRFTGNYKLLEDFYRSTLESSVVRFYSDQAVRFGNVSMGRADIQAVSEVVIGMSASGLSPVAAMKSVVWDIGSGAGYATKELYAMAAMAAAVLGGSVGSELDGWEGAQFGYFPSREDFMSAIVGETSAASMFPSVPALGKWLFRFAAYAYPVFVSGSGLPVDSTALTGVPSMTVPSAILATSLVGQYGITSSRTAVVPYVSYVTMAYELGYGSDGIRSTPRAYGAHSSAIGSGTGVNSSAAPSSMVVGVGNYAAKSSMSLHGVGLLGADSPVYSVENLAYTGRFADISTVVADECDERSVIYYGSLLIPFGTVGIGSHGEVSWYKVHSYSVDTLSVSAGDYVVNSDGVKILIDSIDEYQGKVRLVTTPSKIAPGTYTVSRYVPIGSVDALRGFVSDEFLPPEGTAAPVYAVSHAGSWPMIETGDRVLIGEVVSAEGVVVEKSYYGNFIMSFDAGIEASLVVVDMPDFRSCRICSALGDDGGLISGRYNRPVRGSVFEVGIGDSDTVRDTLVAAGEIGSMFSGIMDADGIIRSGMDGNTGFAGENRLTAGLLAGVSSSRLFSAAGFVDVSDKLSLGSGLVISATEISAGGMVVDVATGVASGEVSDMSLTGEIIQIGYPSDGSSLRMEVSESDINSRYVKLGGSVLSVNELSVSSDNIAMVSGRISSENVELGASKLSFTEPFGGDVDVHSQKVFGYGTANSKPGDRGIGSGLYSNDDEAGLVVMDDDLRWMSLGITPGGSIGMKVGNGDDADLVGAVGSNVYSFHYMCDMTALNGSVYHVDNFDFLLWRDRPNCALRNHNTPLYHGNLHLCAYGITAGSMDKYLPKGAPSELPVAAMNDHGGSVRYGPMTDEYFLGAGGSADKKYRYVPAFDFGKTADVIDDHNAIGISRIKSGLNYKRSTVYGYGTFGSYAWQQSGVVVNPYYYAYNDMISANAVLRPWMMAINVPVESGPVYSLDAAQVKYTSPTTNAFSAHFSALCAYDMLGANNTQGDFADMTNITVRENILARKMKVPVFADFMHDSSGYGKYTGGQSSPEARVHGGNFYGISSTKFNEMSEYVQYAVGNDNSFTGCGDFSVSFSATATDETYAVKNTNTHGLFLCDVFREHMGSDGHGVYEQKLHIPMVEGRNDSTLRYWTTNGEYYSYGRMEYRVPRNAPRLLSYTELKQDGGITVAVALKPWSTSITTHSGRSIRNAANAIHYGESTKNKKAVSVKLMKVPSNVNASASATGTITVGLVDMNSDNVAPYLTLAPVKIPIGDVKVNQATGNGSLVVDVYMPDLLANARYGRFNSVVGPEVAFDDMFDNMKIDRSGWGFAILDFDVQLITNIEV